MHWFEIDIDLEELSHLEELTITDGGFFVDGEGDDAVGGIS